MVGCSSQLRFWFVLCSGRREEHGAGVYQRAAAARLHAEEQRLHRGPRRVHWRGDAHPDELHRATAQAGCARSFARLTRPNGSFCVKFLFVEVNHDHPVHSSSANLALSRWRGGLTPRRMTQPQVVTLMPAHIVHLQHPSCVRIVCRFADAFLGCGRRHLQSLTMPFAAASSVAVQCCNEPSPLWCAKAHADCRTWQQA